MRDLLVTVVVFGMLPIIFVYPFVGILVWSWLGYMNPHRLAFGFAHDFSFAFWVAIATIVGAFVSRERMRIPVTGLTVTWMLFVVWMGVTTIFAFYPDDAWVQFQKVFKIQLMSFATIVLMCSRERIRMLIWIIVLSLGYFGTKGGAFTIISGGSFRVWGPPGSFVEGNNELALALLMILPLMEHLRSTSESKWVRGGLLTAMILCGFSIVGSHSRGALVGGVAMVFFLWLKSRHKSLVGAVLIATIAILVAFMPTQWDDRMRTIEYYEEDASAVGRLQVWAMALNLANDKVLGGGFELWSADTFARYYPQKAVPHDAHSIYFKVLGEHGWTGLVLFLWIGILAWRTGSWIIRQCDAREGLAWLSNLARMIQVSLAAFATGGAFLGLSYFDLYWHMVAILVLGKVLVQQHLAEPSAAAQPAAAVGQEYEPIPGLPAEGEPERGRESPT